MTPPDDSRDFDWPPLAPTPCPARLAGGSLRCNRVDEHSTHVYAASEAGDRHDETGQVQ